MNLCKSYIATHSIVMWCYRTMLVAVNIAVSSTLGQRSIVVVSVLTVSCMMESIECVLLSPTLIMPHGEVNNAEKRLRVHHRLPCSHGVTVCLKCAFACKCVWLVSFSQGGHPYCAWFVCLIRMDIENSLVSSQSWCVLFHPDGRRRVCVSVWVCNSVSQAVVTVIHAWDPLCSRCNLCGCDTLMFCDLSTVVRCNNTSVCRAAGSWFDIT